MNGPPADTKGEHPNGRKAMGAIIEAQIREGVDPAKATERARQCAIRADQRRHGERK